MEGNEFIGDVEPGSGQDVTTPLTDISCELSPTCSLEDPAGCVGSLNTAISIPSFETFLVTRISPQVVGRTVSTTSTTSGVEYSSLTTSHTCSSIGIEAGDSGFSSWTGVIEPHPHFSPTLTRLDSESQPGSDESNASNRMATLSTNGPINLCSLFCADPIDEELCDCMFVRDLARHESASCFTSGTLHAVNWLVDNNQNQREPKIQISPMNAASEATWNSLASSMHSSPSHPETCCSSFRPIKSFESSHRSDSTNLIKTKDHPDNDYSFIGATSTSSCVCSLPFGNRRPDSAPVHISRNQLSFSVYDTDSESAGEQADGAAPIDTADDGDDERDAESTPTSHRRKRKQVRGRLSRHSFSGNSQSSLAQTTQWSFNRLHRVRLRSVDVPVQSTVPCTDALVCMSPPRTEFRIDPLWLQGREVLSPLASWTSAAPQNFRREQRVFDESSSQATDRRCSFPSYHHGPLVHHGAVMHLLPPMPDVVPQNSHLFRVCALRQDPNAVTTHNPMLHCLDSINPAPPTPTPSPPLVAPRCASVPLGLPVENTGFCPIQSYRPRCTDSYVSTCNLDGNGRSRRHIPATSITTNNHSRNPEFSTRRSAVYAGHSTSSAGPARSDSAGFVHDQLSLLARRMADIGDELVAQNNALSGGRHSLPSDRPFNESYSGHRVNPVWNLSASLASLVAAPFDYVHRIIRLAGRSLSSTSTGIGILTTPTHTAYEWTGQRRRTRTYTGTHHHRPQSRRTAIPTVLHVHETRSGCPARDWSIPPVHAHVVHTSTPTLMNARCPVSPDSSSCAQTSSPTDETRNTDYIFHFE